jgi:hypothetical protein
MGEEDDGSTISVNLERAVSKRTRPAGFSSLSKYTPFYACARLEPDSNYQSRMEVKRGAMPTLGPVSFAQYTLDSGQPLIDCS